MWKGVCLVVCAALLLGVILSYRFQLGGLLRVLDSSLIGPEGIRFVHRPTRFPIIQGDEHRSVPGDFTHKRAIAVNLNEEKLPDEVYREYLEEKMHHEIKIREELNDAKIGQVLLGEHMIPDDPEYKDRKIIIWRLEDDRNVVLIRSILYSNEVKSEKFIQDEEKKSKWERG